MMSRMTVRLLCGKFHRCPKHRLKQRRVETVRLSQVWFRILSLVFTIGTVHSLQTLNNTFNRDHFY